MSPEQEHRLEEIFSAARDLPPRERTALLERACGGDAELRRQADSLPARLKQGDDDGKTALDIARVSDGPSLLPWLGPGRKECEKLLCKAVSDTVTVNRYCLLDCFETAVQLARHWSTGKYNTDGAYVGPAEPGPYFIIEVLRKRLEAA
jgi:hypothetical protein